MFGWMEATGFSVGNINIRVGGLAGDIGEGWGVGKPWVILSTLEVMVGGSSQVGHSGRGWGVGGG